MNKTIMLGCLAAALSVGACQPANEGPGSAAALDVARAAARPAENVPISLDYSLVGAPLVGETVAVNVEITTEATDRAVRLAYQAAEAGDMTFPESQATSATLPPLSTGNVRRHQFALIPQREGRIFVVVSAELESDRGIATKSISIPVQVGRSEAARRDPAASESER